MSSSYLIFNFGGNEEAAQQARHRLDGWRHAFRLGNKLTFVFDRAEAGDQPEQPRKDAAIRIIVRVDFSDHEKLSRQRWTARLQAEEPLKDAAPQMVQPGDPAYDATAEEFETLSRGAVVKSKI